MAKEMVLMIPERLAAAMADGDGDGDIDFYVSNGGSFGVGEMCIIEMIFTISVILRKLMGLLIWGTHGVTFADFDGDETRSLCREEDFPENQIECYLIMVKVTLRM